MVRGVEERGRVVPGGGGRRESGGGWFRRRGGWYGGGTGGVCGHAVRRRVGGGLQLFACMGGEVVPSLERVGWGMGLRPAVVVVAKDE